MRSEIVIRAAKADDWQRLADGNTAMARESEGKMLDAARIASGVRAVLADADKGRYYIAEIDGSYAGQAMVTREWSDWRDGWFWWFQSVYVLPEHRRRGAFRGLYHHVRAAAKAAGNVCGLRLYVERENHAALKTYRALNMVDAGYALMEEDWSAG